MDLIKGDVCSIRETHQREGKRWRKRAAEESEREDGGMETEIQCCCLLHYLLLFCIIWLNLWYAL